ncbi:peptide ABC transporter substrate-binding protein [Pseudomonas fluorescens]|jgi:transmembrane sensor|uniref:Peptide ABC transporter substrate-binding protein n=1 Tax=Pseudomonas frederiksbergensis TaxID=104087 RepID=A0A0B1YTG4_9PSED|nr:MULTISPECIES: FecR family protein [Pseudomonas]KHK61989.1 peptide ABC transporter substrate-binding protein [Pseudomonas frederiksbergensis]KJH86903.1 peptide ABC transporter substrate-binding protein [Pseudomonas fluorescens]MBI6619815.1 FecR family protein [Pseudomonas corrugata]MBI6695535.1 FecR family protein [Pseudomonas corrugata]
MMDSRECPCGQSRVRDEAAQWFVRLQNPVMSVEERQRFEAWLDEHANHRDEIQLLQGIWSATDLLPRERLQALCERPAERAKRRPLLRYAVAAGLLAVAVGLGLFSGLGASSDYRGEFATVLGERRHVALPDGSLVDLNSRSHVRVVFEHRKRRVELVEGEALFRVEHDAGRPFTVDAGNGQVTVTGTRFDVRRDADSTRVAVEEGSVKVQGRDFPINLTAGLGTRIDAQGKVAAPYAINADELTAWRNGKLVFNNAPLSDVAEQVSRYRDKPLRVANAAVGNLRLTSVFRSDNPEALLKALPNILPVAVRTLDDGSQEIISK